MNPEERELLNRAIKLSEENNKMLRSMRRSARFSSLFRLIYWAFIIIVAFYSYVVIIQPILKPLLNGYNEMQSNLKKVGDISSKIPSIPDISLPSWLGGEKK